MKKALLFVFLLISFSLTFNSTVHAQLLPCPASADVIATEIGDICTDPVTLIQEFVVIIVGVAGGLSFLILIVGAIKYLTSAGNPESVDDAKSTISHAVSGLLLVVLSVFVLRLIGVNILAIPGLDVGSSPGGILTP